MAGVSPLLFLAAGCLSAGDLMIPLRLTRRCRPAAVHGQPGVPARPGRRPPRRWLTTLAGACLAARAGRLASHAGRGGPAAGSGGPSVSAVLTAVREPQFDDARPRARHGLLAVHRRRYREIYDAEQDRRRGSRSGGRRGRRGDHVQRRRRSNRPVGLLLFEAPAIRSDRDRRRARGPVLGDLRLAFLQAVLGMLGPRVNALTLGGLVRRVSRRVQRPAPRPSSGSRWSASRTP